METAWTKGADERVSPFCQDMFDTAKTERLKRAEKLGRVYGPKEKHAVIYPTAFRIKEGVERFDDSFQQAEYAYSLIESEG